MTDTAIEAPPVTQGGGMREFIEAVLGDQSGNVVMSLVGGRLPTGKPQVNRPRWFTYPKQLGMMVQFAEEHAEEDVYLSPIIYGEQRDAKGKPSREKSNALSCQAIYMDSDSCPPDRFRLRPSIHVDTSPGHGQDYWLLAEPIPAPRAAEIAHRISLAHKKDGTDPSGWSSSKFLRMPTFNLSYAEPFPVQWQATGELYVDMDVEGAYEDVQLAPGFVEPELPSEPGAAVPPPRPSTAGSPRPPIVTGEDLAPLYDRVDGNNHLLQELLDHKPKVGEKGWRSEQRWALLLELCRAGFEDDEALSMAWHAAASGKWIEDPRGIDGLWWELGRARAQVDAETGRSIPAAERTGVVAPVGPKLLTDGERKWMAGRTTFVEEYVTWAATRVPVLNRPLHEINAWTYLSVVYCETATVWKAQGGLPLNLYSVTIAESSSGKSEAARLMNQAVGQVYPYESPMIGADHSRNAIVERLLEREGMVALANSDEADETFRTQKDAPWAQGVQQAWTEVYDGEVPQQGRVAKKDLARSGTKARVVMHMVGTPEGLYDVLDRTMFKSGYLVRHVWARGEHIPVTRDSIKLGRPEQKRADDLTLAPRYWADRVWRQRASYAAAGQTVDVHLTDEAYDRLDDARWEITESMDKLGDIEVYRPIGRRMLDVLLKVAALVALADGRTAVTRNDAVTALATVEQWLATTIEVVNSVASSAFSRACDDIERFIAGREGRETDASKVYGLMRSIRPRDVDEYLDSLVRQGRLEAIVPKAGGSRKYRVKGAMPTDGGTR